MNTTPRALGIRQLVKTYPQPRVLPAVTAVGGVDLDIGAGTFTTVVGPSGSGKSTMLHCAAGLDHPTSGTVEIAGAEVTAMKPSHRSRHGGFVFQDYNLVSSLTVAQNVALPARLAAAAVESALEQVGLGNRRRQRPAELSGGERQRLAVARVIANRPNIVFADEPTGALDVAAVTTVLDLLVELPRRGTTVVMVTHDPVAAARGHEVVVMSAGRLHRILPGGDAHAVADAVMAAQEVAS